jgi:hypothetical protein
LVVADGSLRSVTEVVWRAWLKNDTSVNHYRLGIFLELLNDYHIHRSIELHTKRCVILSNISAVVLRANPAA